MNALQFFIPIFAIIGLAIVAPTWMHFMGELGDFPAHVEFLLGLAMPVLVLLLGASWLEPRGS